MVGRVVGLFRSLRPLQAAVCAPSELVRGEQPGAHARPVHAVKTRPRLPDSPQVGAQLAFAIAVSIPLLLGFLIGVVGWSRGLGALLVSIATVAGVIATVDADNLGYMLLFEAASVVTGIGLGLFTRRFARRVTS